MKTEEQIREQYRLIRGSLDERGRREWAASEAIALGRGGIALVHRGTGIVPSTIGKGINELRRRSEDGEPAEGKRRVRRPGGGRRRKIEEDPQLLVALEALVEPSTRGDPESALRWTCKSLRVLAEELVRLGHTMGEERYPEADGLFITADCGGSNGYRTRLWKLELQPLADELILPITVCHFPPGTSKWNKIEHRLFSFITMNWRGKPLHTYQTVVNLIAATTTATGLEVQCELDSRSYDKGRKVSDAEMETVQIRPHRFHGEWNYTIEPRSL